MTHVHDHKDSSYFIEQLCTIGVCGALGGVVITMWVMPNGLNFLGPQFQAPLGNPWLSPLFLGGLIVATLVLIRTTAIGNTVRSLAAANDRAYSHRNGPFPCILKHVYCKYANAYGRVLVPCRYVLVLFPLVLYCLGLVPAAFSSHVPININFEGSGPTVSTKGGDVIRSFRELGQAGFTEESRRYYEGRTAQVIGQVTNAEAARFGLVRYKITCCSAVALSLHVRVIVLDPAPEDKAGEAQTRLAGKWVEVSGVIQFRKLHESNEFVTVLEVQTKDVHILPKAPANPFEY